VAKTRIKDEMRNEIVGLSMLAVAALLLVSFWLVPPEAGLNTSKAGAVGGFFVRILAGIAGSGRYLFALILAVAGLVTMRDKTHVVYRQKLGGMFIFFLTVLAWLHYPVQAADTKSYLALGLAGEGGGIAGALICTVLMKGFGRLGTGVILTASTLISLILTTDSSLTAFLRKLLQRAYRFLVSLKNRVRDFLFVDDSADIERAPRRSPARQRPEPVPQPVIIHHEDNLSGQDHCLAPLVSARQPIQTVPADYPEPEDLRLAAELAREEERAAARRTPKGGLTGNPELPGGKTDPSVTEDLEQTEEPDLTPNSLPYRLPGTDLLQEAVKVKNPRISKDITENIKILEDTLDSFGVKVKVTQVSCGPAVTRYEMQPFPGVKVSRILNLADDIALNLAASAVRIEAPVPGKSVVGIEVPKDEVSAVGFREVLETSQFREAASRMSIALGKDISGNPVVADLAAMPHLLIAGATGSGKSVCMNSLICSILYKAKPDEVKLLMIDPKVVELSNYNGLPHLVAPVVTDAKKAAGALKWIVREMENRYNIFATTGVKDLARFNSLKKGTGEELPQILVLIDELADLMMVAPGDVEDSICRLAQMARAAGIHLVVATQRPSVDVITGLIKANIPSRIAFAVSSQIDSRTILDMAGAEKLLGRGDMLFYPVGAAKPLRVQGVYISEQEIGDLVQFCRDQAKPEYIEGVTQANAGGSDRAAEDDLFLEAAQMVVDTGQASVSFLQRRFRIGYSRAARLMDILESKGVVGGYEGSKPRNVLMTQSQLELEFPSEES